jgi:hypothetical protein
LTAAVKLAISDGMSDPDASLESWRRLYDLATRVQMAEPWKRLRETDLFAVEDRGSKELGYVSVMGANGEYRAVAIYRGARGVDAFWRMQSEAISHEEFLEAPQLQLAFVGRSDLEPEDRAVIKALDLTFRGRSAWPRFRSHRPGFLPWLLEGAEMARLADALEQLLAVASRLRIRNALPHPDAEGYLLRAVSSATGTWEDGVTGIPQAEPYNIPLRVSGELLSRAAALPRLDGQLEADLFATPSVVHDPKDGVGRPYFAYLLMLVDGSSGIIVGNDVCAPLPSLEAMWGSIPERLLRHVVAAGALPSRIVVRAPLLRGVLEPIVERLGVSVAKARRLPALDPAKRSALRFFER